MKTAICYYSRHHGNTPQVLRPWLKPPRSISSMSPAAWPPACRSTTASASASGIYYSKFHDTVVHYAAQYLPEGKETFFVCTHGSTACPEKVLCRHHRSSKGQKLPHSWHLLLPRL